MEKNSSLYPLNKDSTTGKIKWIIKNFFKNWKENLTKYILLFIPFLFGIPSFSLWIENHNIVFWILFLLVVIGIIMNIYLEGSALGIKENDIYKLTSEKSRLENDAQRNQDFIDSMKEAIEAVPDDVIEHIFHFLELDNSDRISLYSFDKDTLYMTGRYSSAPELRVPGRLKYPKNEGYIGKVWGGVEDDVFIVEELCDPERAQKRYINEVNRGSNLPIEIINNLSMKSRSYYVRLLRKDHREVAVLVLESKKEKLPKPQNQIDTVLSGEFGRLLVKYVNRNNRQKERGQSNE